MGYSFPVNTEELACIVERMAIQARAAAAEEAACLENAGISAADIASEAKSCGCSSDGGCSANWSDPETGSSAAGEAGSGSRASKGACCGAGTKGGACCSGGSGGEAGAATASASAVCDCTGSDNLGVAADLESQPQALPVSKSDLWFATQARGSEWCVWSRCDALCACLISYMDPARLLAGSRQHADVDAPAQTLSALPIGTAVALQE